MELTHAQGVAASLTAYFSELYRLGVRHVVVSPGSRSTPLAVCAYELRKSTLSGRVGVSGLGVLSELNDAPDEKAFRVFVNIDERSAGFFALGLARVTQTPVVLICTSGSAGAHYYPAVLEAEARRIPLIMLTADRPLDMQGLGAPQTCDQQKFFGSHARLYQEMPQLTGSTQSCRVLRQFAREAYAASSGSYRAFSGAPVQVNVPLAEPLLPDFSALSRCDLAESLLGDEAGTVPASSSLNSDEILRVLGIIRQRKTCIIAGEGTFFDGLGACDLLEFAARLKLPILADPLSGLRSYIAPEIIDAYDTILAQEEAPEFECAIQFGRLPISKRLSQRLSRERIVHLVVDPLSSRDFTCSTDFWLKLCPWDFVGLCLEYLKANQGTCAPSQDQADYLKQWQKLQVSESERIEGVLAEGLAPEAAFVQTVIQEIPDQALLVSANSTTIRLLEQVYRASNKCIDLICNRGLNGIEGNISTALGAAQASNKACFMTGDLTFMHDISALHQQRELLCAQQAEGHVAPSLPIVLFNNAGGGIFEMLPQRSGDAYFERLFVTPQQVDYAHLAHAFDIPYQQVDTPAELKGALHTAWEIPGMTVIEVKTQTQDLPDHLAALRSGESAAARAQQPRVQDKVASSAAKVAAKAELNRVSTGRSVQPEATSSGQVAAGLASDQASFDQYILTVKRNRVSYRVYPAKRSIDKTPVLLLHGFAQSVQSWDYQAQLLSAERTVYVLEWLGCGKSDRPYDQRFYGFKEAHDILEALLEKLDSELHVAAYSMGGRLLLASLRQADAAGRLDAAPWNQIKSIFLESASFGCESLAIKERFRERDEAWAQTFAKLNPQEFADFWEALPIFESQTKLAPATQAQIRDERLRFNPWVAAQYTRASGQHKMPLQSLQGIRVPCAYLAGTHDVRYCKQAFYLAQHASELPEHACIILAQAGHCVHQEKPELFAQELTSFIESCECIPQKG